MKYDLYLFDLDGTLTDPQVGMERSLRYALDAMGITTEITDFARFIGPPLRNSLREIFGLEGEQNELAVTKYREYFAKKGLLENELYPDITNVLAKIKAAGAKTAIATSKVTEYAETIAAHFDFARYFDFIGGDHFDGRRGTKKDIIAHVLKHFGSTDPSRVVMIGDRKYDILGAKAMGIDSIGVLWGFGSREELENAGATYIIDKPAELLVM